LLQENVDDRVRFALIIQRRLRRSPRRDRVGFVEQQHGVFFASQAEHRGDVLRGLADPHRFQFRVAHDQQTPAEHMRDRFGADGLAGAGRAREDERERHPGRVPLAEAPAIENQIVIGDLHQRLIQRPPRRFRQHDIRECPSRHDRFDRLTCVAAGEDSE
jgi:hypothetical protein